MRVRAVSHVALGEENAHTAAASASAIATATRGADQGARARGRSVIGERALLAAKVVTAAAESAEDHLSRDGPYVRCLFGAEPWPPAGRCTAASYAGRARRRACEWHAMAAGWQLPAVCAVVR